MTLAKERVLQVVENYVTRSGLRWGHQSGTHSEDSLKWEPFRDKTRRDVWLCPPREDGEALSGGRGRSMPSWNFIDTLDVCDREWDRRTLNVLHTFLIRS